MTCSSCFSTYYCIKDLKGSSLPHVHDAVEKINKSQISCIASGVSLKTKDFGDKVVKSATPADVKSRPDDRVSN